LEHYRRKYDNVNNTLIEITENSEENHQPFGSNLKMDISAVETECYALHKIITGPEKWLIENKSTAVFNEAEVKEFESLVSENNR
jgi:hypothetical protein